jgi:hypothetical protein
VEVVVRMALREVQAVVEVGKMDLTQGDLQYQDKEMLEELAQEHRV